MSRMVDTPFGPPLPEIDLPRAPLAQVIGQVRFERVASISTEAFIASFQESIRDVYPLLKKEQQATVLVGPDGRVVPGEINSVQWRFAQEPPQWELDALIAKAEAMCERIYRFFRWPSLKSS